MPMLFGDGTKFNVSLSWGKRGRIFGTNSQGKRVRSKIFSRDWGPGGRFNYAGVTASGAGDKKLGNKFYPEPALEMGLRAFSQKYVNAVGSYCNKTAIDMEQYAKKNHKWENQTGDAERNLHAYVAASAAGWRRSIVLSHGTGENGTQYIFYGRYLEYSMGRRFAIIQPTMNHFRAKWRTELKSALNVERVGY